MNESGKGSKDASGDAGQLLANAAPQASGSMLLPRHAEEDLFEVKSALEARTAELTLALSLLSGTLESSADGIVVLNLLGEVVSYNSKFVAIWEFPDEMLRRRDSTELRAHSAQQLNDPEGFLQLLGKRQSEPEIEAFDVIEFKDGRTFERHVFPQRVNQNCVGVVVSTREITHRRLAEAALRLSEEKYRLLWATAGDAFVLFDRENIILEANAAVETIFGHPPDEVIGQPLAILQPERLREAHRRGMQRYLDSGQRMLDWRAAEAVGLHRDGSEIPIEIAFNHLSLGEKELFAGFIRDISERKRGEAERAELLSREQQARQEAESLNRAKDEFLATLSHELRTPLNAIVGWSHLLEDNRLGEEERVQGIEAIQRNARLQTRLVEDLLDVSRIISGKMKLEVRPVRLSTVIEDAIESVLPAAQAKSIQIQRGLDSSTGVVSGDPARLQQVVWNLLSNAIKFTPPGGRVQIRLEQSGSQIAISVSDSGVGIGAEVLPHVFERFRQADQSSTRNHGGLGLGLAIVRHIVEAHGGTVEAHSEGEGQGATFRVKLPLM